MDNLEEMDKVLEMYNHLRVNQEETENINRPVTEIDSVKKKNLPTSKSSEPECFY